MHRLWRYQLYTLFFMLYALLKMLYAFLQAISNKKTIPPLHPKKLSVPLQAILGYKSTDLSKTK